MARSDPIQSLLHGDPLKPGDASPSTSDVDLTALAKSIGHDFARRELAAEALTHRSALDRRAGLKASFPNANERLEFLGDRVLSLAMASLLLRRFPHEREGELARRFSGLVSAGKLVEIAQSIGLAEHIRLGDAGSGRIRPNILADALEALLGAIFLDAGYERAAACVERLWDEHLASQSIVPRDPKTALQEWAQARRFPLPDYREVGREGPPHAPVFVVDVSVKGHRAAEGRGSNKREAERRAAAALLERLGES